MVESAKRHVEILEKLEFYDIALSLKASNLDLCIEAHKKAAETFEYPLHIGVTHSGTDFGGTIASSIGLRNYTEGRHRKYNKSFFIE